MHQGQVFCFSIQTVNRCSLSLLSQFVFNSSNQLFHSQYVLLTLHQSSQILHKRLELQHSLTCYVIFFIMCAFIPIQREAIVLFPSLIDLPHPFWSQSQQRLESCLPVFSTFRYHIFVRTRQHRSDMFPSLPSSPLQGFYLPTVLCLRFGSSVVFIPKPLPFLHPVKWAQSYSIFLSPAFLIFFPHNELLRSTDVLLQNTN